MPALHPEGGQTLKFSLIDIEGAAYSKMQSRNNLKPKECVGVPNTFPMIAGALPSLVLPHTPKRYRGSIYVSSPGTVAFGQSEAEVQSALNAVAAEYIGAACFVTGPAVLDVRITTELWAGLFNNNTPTNPSPSQPAVPATGVAQQNGNAYPVQVVISPNGATITNVSVNGVTVGTAAGTYFVPAYGSISIAYSVAIPTWVWTNANAQATATTWVSVIKEITR